MASVTQRVQRRWRSNGWMIAFFVALLAFEIAREWAVVATANEPMLATLATVNDWGGGFITAEGRWTRIDGGERLTPNIVRIECARDRGECNEVFLQVNGQVVGAPHLSTYKAQFSPDAVTYDNDGSICVRYATRIDLKLRKAFAIRTRKTDNSPECRQMESRIEMQLGDGWADAKNPVKEHFLPLSLLTMAVMSWL